jgi:membrane associated rhomboid family serine protease
LNAWWWAAAAGCVVAYLVGALLKLRRVDRQIKNDKEKN